MPRIFTSCVRIIRDVAWGKIQARGLAADVASEKPSISSGVSSKFLGGRYGSRMLRAGRSEAHVRMRMILGCETSSRDSAGKIGKVTVSILQTMKYLHQIPLAFKQQLTSYRLWELGKEIDPILTYTKDFLREEDASRSKSSKGTSK